MSGFQSFEYPDLQAQYLDPSFLTPVLEAWNGAGSSPLGLTGILDDIYYAASIMNAGTGGALNVLDSLGGDLFSLGDDGGKISNLAASGDVTIGGILDVTGPVTLHDLLDVEGPVTLHDLLEVDGPVTLHDTLLVEGAATFEATLSVQGAATFDSAVTLGNSPSDTVTVAGPATFASGLAVTAGNLAFNSVGAAPGQRITGDFSSATAANRVMLQSSVANGFTYPGILPNGSNQVAGIAAFNGANPAASSYVDLLITATEARIYSGHTGAAYLPLGLWAGGQRLVNLGIAGEVGLTTAGGKLGTFGVTPVAQQTGGAATAGATYTAAEQGMLNRAYSALRAYGLLS